MLSSTFKNTWELEQQYRHQRNGALSHMDEKAGPTALVLNLSQLPIASALSTIEAGGADAAKEHPGVRVSMVILRMLSAGFSSVQGDATEGAGKRGGGGKNNAKTSSFAARPRYGTMENGSVLLHSYELINKKGTYSKGGLSDTFICLSPGKLYTSNMSNTMYFI